MSCDYCTKDANYEFQNGERVCKSCLNKYPISKSDCIKKIVEQEKEIKRLRSLVTNVRHDLFKKKLITFDEVHSWQA